MKRRIAASLPLYIASIVMLVFIVLPHHHHNDYICFNTSHCEKPEAGHSKSHEHDPFSGGEGCVKHLFQTEITKSLTLNHADNCQKGHCHHFSISLFTLAGSMNPLLFELRSALFYPDACDEQFRSVLYADDKAGRAPPIA